MTSRAGVLAAAAWAAWIGGCEGSRGAPAVPRPAGPEPLSVQQVRAYPELRTGRFVCLADFEDAPGRPPGHQQLGHFSVRPPEAGGACRFVVNITRTGAGAMEVRLPGGSELAYASPHGRDLSGYRLVSAAVHSQTLRDDLQVSLGDGRRQWVSRPVLLEPGWNNVLIDIGQAGRAVDLTSVREIAIRFADAAGGVDFVLDDLVLADNRRSIEPAPPGTRLTQSGLDYSLQLPQRPRPVTISQGDDGLWRFGDDQPVLQLVAPGDPLGEAGEHLTLMGQRRIGRLELLEHNTLRVRLANTWYFPSRSGEWASLAVRQVRWEHTFYGDGRWVTAVELNNAGGVPIGAVRLRFPEPVAAAGHGRVEERVVQGLPGPVGRWCFLRVLPGLRKDALMDGYLAPGRLRLILASSSGEALTPGDADRDGFDESQGCYYVRAEAGGAAVNCRFVLQPPAGGTLDPIFRVAGGFAAQSGAVNVSSEGLAIRRLECLPDGSVLFVLPGRIVAPTSLEVSGRPAAPENP